MRFIFFPHSAISVFCSGCSALHGVNPNLNKISFLLAFPILIIVFPVAQGFICYFI